MSVWFVFSHCVDIMSVCTAFYGFPLSLIHPYSHASDDICIQLYILILHRDHVLFTTTQEACGIRAIYFVLYPYDSLSHLYFPVEPPYVLVVYGTFAKFGDATNSCSGRILYMQCLLPTNHM